MDIRSLVRPCILALEPYSTARDDYKGGNIDTWLDANESPFPNGCNRYPDPHQRELKQEIARVKNIAVGKIFIGNGSDEAIDLLYRIFCEPGRDNAVAISPTYGMYSVAAAINDVGYRPVSLGQDFRLDTDALLAACDSRTKLMWVCSPNNPTANAFPLDQIERLADTFGGILAVDEAYADFSPRGSMLALLDRHPNVVVLQTLSKAWGLAALRLGLAFASEQIAGLMARVKYPYNVCTPAQAAGLKAVKAGAVADNVARITAERDRLARELPQASVVERVWPSDANFFLVRTRQSADAVYERLVSGGVIVRNRSRVPLCADCLRITVGTRAENDKMMEILKSL